MMGERHQDELVRIMSHPQKTYVRPINFKCYALGKVNSGNGHFSVRQIVWGRLMARAEKRDGEKIRPAVILTRKL